MLNGQRRRLRPVGRIGFGEDVPDVIGNGIGADKQVRGDLTIAFAGSNEA